MLPLANGDVGRVGAGVEAGPKGNPEPYAVEASVARDDGPDTVLKAVLAGGILEGVIDDLGAVGSL